MSSEMEDAAAILGARTWRIMRAVTFPLVLPGIVAGFIMAFLEAMADLGAPLLISVPARFQVITTQLFQFFQFPSKVEVAAAYSIPLLLVTGGLLFVQRRLLARKAFATLTGKGGAQRTIQLGRWRYVALAWCLAVATLSLFLPGSDAAVGGDRQSMGARLEPAQFHARQFPLHPVRTPDDARRHSEQLHVLDGGCHAPPC